jgi:hypothetical protein
MNRASETISFNKNEILPPHGIDESLDLAARMMTKEVFFAVRCFGDSKNN